MTPVEARPTEEQRASFYPPERPRLLVGYVIFTVVASTIIVLGAGSVPRLGLGIALATCLMLTGLLLLLRQRSIRLASQRWRDVMPCYLSVQDDQLRIIETNTLFRRDFGDAVGEFCYKAYKQRGLPCHNCPVLKTLKDGRSHNSEESVITMSGEVARVVVTSAPLFDDSGRCVAVVEMSTNVTEVEAIQHELQQSKQELARLFDIVPCYISVQDRQMRIVESNRLFKEDFGECTGSTCFRAYKGRESVCEDCPVEKTFLDGEVHNSEEIVVTRDCDRADVLVHSAPIVDSDGKISLVMEVSTNVTEFKQEHQLAMMGMAVAGMAHRIKNILMGLEGGIFVLNTGFETDDAATIDEGWKMVGRNVEKISRMVKDLLYCSKGRIPSVEDGVRPDEIVREVHELYRARTAEEGIELSLEVGRGLRPGTFDAEAIYNMVVNLVTNAVDACRFDPAGPEKGHAISLRCRQDQTGEVVIEVEDNGAGIPEEVCDKVFKGFFSTKGTEGTGLGLLVVQKVAEEHGGSVSFSSRDGEGTTFTVVLPPQRGADRRTGDGGDEPVLKKLAS